MFRTLVALALAVIAVNSASLPYESEHDVEFQSPMQRQRQEDSSEALNARHIASYLKLNENSNWHQVSKFHSKTVRVLPQILSECSAIGPQPGKNTAMELGRCYAQLVIAGLSAEAWHFYTRYNVVINYSEYPVNQYSLLWDAIQARNLSDVSLLLQAGAIRRIEDDQWFMEALEMQNSQDIVQLFVQHGYQVDSFDDDMFDDGDAGPQLNAAAAQYGSDDNPVSRVKHSAKVLFAVALFDGKYGEVRVDGETYQISEGYTKVDLMRELLPVHRAGLKVLSDNWCGTTLLRQLARTYEQNVELFELVLSYSDKASLILPASGGETILHDPLHPECLKTVLKAGGTDYVNIIGEDYIDDSAWTPLMMAAKRCELANVRILISAGAFEPRRAPQNRRVESALAATVRNKGNMPDQQCNAVIDELMSVYGRYLALEHVGYREVSQPPLIIATQKNNVQAVSQLLTSYVRDLAVPNINTDLWLLMSAQDGHGLTALMYALRSRNVGIIQLILPLCHSAILKLQDRSGKNAWDYLSEWILEAGQENVADVIQQMAIATRRDSH